MTARSPVITVKCPICKISVQWTPEQRFKPFCSERCKLIDLGDWATESHKIPGEPVQDLDQDSIEP